MNLNEMSGMEYEAVGLFINLSKWTWIKQCELFDKLSISNFMNNYANLLYM